MKLTTADIEQQFQIMHQIATTNGGRVMVHDGHVVIAVPDDASVVNSEVLLDACSKEWYRRRARVRKARR